MSETKMLNEGTTRMTGVPQTLSEAFTREYLRAPAIPRVAGLPSVKARAFRAREKQPHQNDGFSRSRLYSAKKRGGPAHLCARKSRVPSQEIRQKKCHTMQSNFQRISLKTNDRYPNKVTHFFEVAAR
jgi:hypothetical protein